MPLSYEEVLNRWDRSRAFGDQRDLGTFSRDLNARTGTEDFSQGLRDGWWTRASTRANQYFFHPVAEATTQPLGEAIGGLFGEGGAEVGGRIGRSVPRMLANTIPLLAAEVFTGGGATPLIAGALGAGALFGGETYAETGSPKAALISGATAAALPAIGRFGGNTAVRALGLGERVAPGLTEGAAFRGGWFPKENVSKAAFQTARIGGSQLAMSAALEGSGYAQAKTLGQDYDFLSPDFLAQQIPFTIFDIVHAVKTPLPRAGEIKAKLTQPMARPTEPYVPPISTPEQQHLVETTISQLIDKIDNPATPQAEKSLSLETALAVAADPVQAAKIRKVSPTSIAPQTITGHGRKLIGGNYKVLIPDDVNGDKTVFINGVEPTVEPDGRLTFQARPSQVNTAVTSPLTREQFGLVRPGEQTLPPQPVEWQGFPPDQQKTLEEAGVQPTAEMPEDVKAYLRATAEQIEETQGRLTEAKGKIEVVPKSAEEIPNLLREHYEGTQGFYERFANNWEQAQKEPLPLELQNKLPPVPVDHVRVWRGETGKPPTVEDEYTGRWFSPSYGYATGYGTGRFSYLDVPKSRVSEEVARGVDPDLGAGEAPIFIAKPEELKGVKSIEHVPQSITKIREFVKSGASPTQAIESARLSTQTPLVDQTYQTLATQKKDANVKAREGTEKVKPIGPGGQEVLSRGKSLIDTEGKRPYFDSASQAQEYLDTYKQANVWDKAEWEVTSRNDRGKEEWYIGTRLGKKSVEGAVEPDFHNYLSENDPLGVVEERGAEYADNLSRNDSVARSELPVESRPDVSFDDALEQLTRASKSPRVFAGEAGLDVPDGIVAIQQGKVVLPLLKEGKTGLKEINAVLKDRGIREFKSEKDMKNTMRAVLAGLVGFREYRNFGLDSVVPHDAELTAATGVQHETDGLKNALTWFSNHKDSGIFADLARGLMKAVAPDVPLTFNQQMGWKWVERTRFNGTKDFSINVPWLPTAEKAQKWGLNLLHEFAHHATKDLESRNDPTAVQFKATLVQIREALLKSPELPKRVRNVIALANSNKWYENYGKPGMDVADIEAKVRNAMGPEHSEWLDVFHTLVHPDELTSGVFGSPKMVDLMTKTRMPKTLKQTVLNFFSQAWGKAMNLVGGVKPLTDSALEQMLQSFDNYLTGPKIPPRVLEIKPTLTAGESFLFGLAPYDEKRNLLGGKHPLPKNGQVDEKAFKSIGGVGKPLQDDEISLYKSLVPEAFSGGKVDVPKLVEGLKKNGPVVEIRKLGGTPEADQSRQQLQRDIHRLDTEWRDWRNLDESSAPNETLLELSRQVLETEQYEQYGPERYDSDPQYSFISPKPESEMPGYVEGLVRVPLRGGRRTGNDLALEASRTGRDFQEVGKEYEKDNIHYRGPHFGSEDTNVLAFYRGYEETLPDGTKAFHVIEVQSDWGQTRSRQEVEINKLKERTNPKFYRIEEDGGKFKVIDPSNNRDYRGAPTKEYADTIVDGLVKRAQEGLDMLERGVAPHPLLRVYETLALKAAIAHAKEIGATKVILSDAETAMMTEGHDRHATERRGWEVGGTFFDRGDRRMAEAVGRRENLPVIEINKGEVKQEKGMRLHYDQTLPSAMEKLTGEKGVPVDVGQHKSTKLFTGPNQMEHVPVPEEFLNDLNDRDARGELAPGEYDRLIREKHEQTKGSPVFRDAFGQPKTQITGRIYDISNVEGALPLFDTKVPKLQIRQSAGYNARDFIRDDFIANGVRPEALASRIDTAERLFRGEGLLTSVAGFESNRDGNALPSTNHIGSVNEGLKQSLASPKPGDVGEATMNLLADEVPVHGDLWWQMKQDLATAVKVYTNIKKGNLPGEIPAGTVESLKLAQVQLNSMHKALEKQGLALKRWEDLGGMTYEGFEDEQAGRLTGRELPGPPDPTGVQDVAHGLLGLTEVRRGTSEAELKGEGKLGWFTRNLMLTQYVKKLFPAFRPVADHVREHVGKAIERITTLNLSYAYDHETKGFSKTVQKNNDRVAQTESLTSASSDIKRMINQWEAKGYVWKWDDKSITDVLARFNQKDRDAIKLEFDSERARHHVWTEQILPQSLDQINRENTAKVIVSHEAGMLPDTGRELSEQLYEVLAQGQEGKNPLGTQEALRVLSTKMQANTFLSALTHAQGSIDDVNRHIEFMRSRPSYVSEQRYDAHHLVMRGPSGEPFRTSAKTKEELIKRQKVQEAKGYTFLEYIPKSDANTPAGGVNANVLDSLKELDVQTANRLKEALKGVDPTIVDRVLSETQRAAQYEASSNAFRPVPNVTRKFVEGREYLNMLENSHEFYVRANNWLRHRLTDVSTSLDMLHPEIAGDRVLRKFSDQHVQNSLTPDNPFFRKIVEATYFQRLGYALGNSLLESVQNLATGMQAVISETGSVGDAFSLWQGAVKNILKFHATGKWDNVEHQEVMDRAARYGAQGLTTWNDIVDPDRESTFTILNRKGNVASQTLNVFKYGARKWATIFQRYNDQIGWLAGYDLARSKGMEADAAFNFAWDLKERGYYSGGKAQRPVGLWSIKTKPVPQLLSSLQTYTLGWFSQMATDWKVGFGGHSGFNASEKLAAQKAFVYGLAAQAVLAGAIGMPGMGQGMALLKQATGLDLKGWLRANLASLLDEDTDNGGLLTNLAMRGGLAGVSPIDPSNRAAISFPFVGIDPYKGFDLSQLLGAPGATVSDAVQGLLAAARGDSRGVQKLLPSALKAPAQLIQGEGNVRDRRGALLYKLTPAERFFQAAGLPSSRIQSARDTAEVVKNLNVAAQRAKQGKVDQIAKLVRQGKAEDAHLALVEYQRQNPNEDMKTFVRAVASRVEAQTVPYDYRRDLNPAADIAGLGSRTASTEMLRKNVRSTAAASLGLVERPNRNALFQAQVLDDLMNSDPYLPRAEAVRRAEEMGRVRRQRTFSVLPEYQ